MGLDGVSLRYFNVFGPRQDPSSPYSGVISLFADAMSQGRRPIIYGDGPQTRDFTYVAQRRRRQPRRATDVRGPLGGAVFNVGTGRRISLLDLVAAINESSAPTSSPSSSRRGRATSATPRPASTGSRPSSATAARRLRGGPAADARVARRNPHPAELRAGTAARDGSLHGLCGSSAVNTDGDVSRPCSMNGGFRSECEDGSSVTPSRGRRGRGWRPGRRGRGRTRRGRRGPGGPSAGRARCGGSRSPCGRSDRPG